VTKSCPASGDQDVITALLDGGLILEEKKGRIVVSQVIPELAKKFGEIKPEAGDVVLKIQGQTIDSPKDLPLLYKEIKAEETVKLTFSREGKEVFAEFIKEVVTEGKTLMIKK
jgi:S1-C subfamily serine protease